MYKTLITYIAILAFVSLKCQAGMSEFPFNVKPGGMEQTFQSEADGLTCIFTYACQGGTNEEWVMNIEFDEATREYTCQVERPSGKSYLYFQQFTLQAIGMSITQAGAQSRRDEFLKPHEYRLDRDTNAARHNEGAFQSQLSFVRIRGKSIYAKHREL